MCPLTLAPEQEFTGSIHSGNIGARALHRAAGDLEDACKAQEPSDTINVLFSGVNEALREVMDGLAVIEADAAPARAKGHAVDPREISTLLKKIRTLLEDTDSEATESVETLLRLVQGTTMASTVEKIAAALSAYDFEAATAELDTLDVPT